MPTHTVRIHPFFPKQNPWNISEEEFPQIIQHLKISKKTERISLVHRAMCLWSVSSENSRRLSQVFKGLPPFLIIASFKQRQSSGSGGLCSSG